MPDTDSTLILILISIALGLLVLLTLVSWGLSRRLARLESHLMQNPGGAGGDAQAALSSAETTPGGAFEAFLSEDPARRSLPKGEQFAAYRKWRQERGLNWSGS